MGRFRIPMVEITDVRGTATREVDNVAVATVSALGRDAKGCWIAPGRTRRVGPARRSRPMRTAMCAGAIATAGSSNPAAPTASSATPKTPPA